MTKREFLSALNRELGCLSPEDRARSFEYYSEIIDDRIESGVDEHEAVRMLGDVKTIADGIINEVPISKLIKSRVKIKRSAGPTKIVLMIFGGLIVVPVIIALIASFFAVYVSLWTVPISLFAAALACAVAGVCGVLAGVLYTFTVGVLEGLWLLGASLVALGLIYPLFLIGKGTLIAMAWLTKKTLLHIKKRMLRREEY